MEEEDRNAWGYIWKMFRGFGECVLIHVFFSSHSEAERLRKQWEEEEEERLRQMSVPTEPKSEKIHMNTHTQTHNQLIEKANEKNIVLFSEK